MIGGFSFFTQNSGELEQRRGNQTGYYFGDTWRVKPGLTLNFGMRYEPYSLFSDKLDRNLITKAIFAFMGKYIMPIFLQERVVLAKQRSRGY